MNVPSRELLPIVRAALERGQHVLMTANGSSMLPFIHDGDTIELESLRAAPQIGDILLVEGVVGHYVVHRVIRVKGDAFLLRGDAQTQTEGPYTRSRALGKVIASYRGGRARVHRGGRWRLAGLVWLHSAPLGNYLFRLAWPIWQLGRRVAKQAARGNDE